MSPFFNVLYSARVSQGEDDKLCWMPLKRTFEVKILSKVLLPNVDSSFLWKSNWRSECFSLVYFICTYVAPLMLSKNFLYLIKNIEFCII